ncbi:hypothetical protein O7606_14470 [Micromonospora sp. WMMD882]|uniref:hypothetical protein n=1 Tax=Micromonospora sp. WMMD882 TaxID=3015151 RepID=UPI00248B804E|nr:hypothetical protein [Micromonospora sp. WMMD882]WBB77491.1 hypothetical protein O7606_14470 [Micromonospora sp. WMMD882]
MIPEEDLGPSWLRGYGDIEADIRQMREFANKLEAEVRKNYAPHLSYIADDMSVPIPPPCAAFGELVDFLRAHQDIQQRSTNEVYHLANHTGGLATAAGAISEQYADADAFARARVSDVERALRTAQADQPPAAPVPPDATGPGPEVLK